MRYLYGDSVPFPLQYNFLTTLETFVSSAARAVELQFEMQRLEASTAGAAASRAKSLQELDNFHQSVMRAVHECATRTTHPVAADYARQIQEHGARLLEQARSTHTQSSERDQAQVRSEIDRRRSEIRAALETFLTVGRLPTTESRVSMRLEGHHNELSAVFTNPLGIVTSFKLSTANAPAWHAPRKVSEFAQGVDLQIGIKKSWIKRSVQPEMVHIDDFYISGFELSDDAAQIRLRKKPDTRDAFVFILRRHDAELHAEVQRADEEMTDGLPATVDAQDRAQLERLWQLLRAGCADVLVHKERLIGAELDGLDVFGNDRAIPFIERIIKILAPIVVEISRRSPNPNELSLKHENDGGRREELYLRKADLANKLDPLSAASRAVFAPLAITREESGIEVSVED
jgi:hypothetical protein